MSSSAAIRSRKPDPLACAAVLLGPEVLSTGRVSERGSVQVATTEVASCIVLEEHTRRAISDEEFRSRGMNLLNRERTTTHVDVHGAPMLRSDLVSARFTALLLIVCASGANRS